MKNFAAVIFVFLISISTTKADLLQDSLNYVKEAEYSALYAWKSRHWLTMDYTNSTHHMVGLRINNFVFGRFKNSYDRETFFFGLYGEFDLDPGWHLIGAVGAMKGYRSCFGDDGNSAKWCPMFAAGITYSGYTQYLQPALFQLGDATNIGIKSDF